MYLLSATPIYFFQFVALNYRIVWLNEGKISIISKYRAINHRQYIVNILHSEFPAAQSDVVVVEA